VEVTQHLSPEEDPNLGVGEGQEVDPVVAVQETDQEAEEAQDQEIDQVLQMILD